MNTTAAENANISTRRNKLINIEKPKVNRTTFNNKIKKGYSKYQELIVHIKLNKT